MLQNGAFPDSIIQVSYAKLGAKKPFLQYGAVGFQPKMISRYTVYSETKGSDAYWRGCNLKSSPARALPFPNCNNVLCHSHTWTHCRKKKSRVCVCIYIFKKNVNIGQRCSSLHTVQSHGLC